MHKPYPHQEQVSEIASNVNEYGFFWEVGCGKSGGLIHTLRKVFNRQKRIGRTVIFSPLVTLYNWKNEFKLHSKIDLKKVHVLDKASRRVKDIVEATDSGTGILDKEVILILNYEAVQNEEVFNLIMEWNPEIVVLDESHLCKNPKAKRAKKIMRITDAAKRRYLMTGTPILNNIGDIFMQYRILDRGESFGKNFNVFQNKYMQDMNAGWKNKPNYFPDWQPREELYAEVQKLIYRKASRLKKTDVLKDLPPFVETTRYVQLGPEQKKYYEQMKRDFVAFVKEEYENGEKSGAVVAQLAITKALRLQQIVSGYVSTDDGDNIVIQNNPRLKELANLLEALVNDHKVIVWCSFRENYKMIGSLLKGMGIPHVFITGEMNLDQKQESMDRFEKDPKVRVVVANRRAAGIGINLIAASYSIVFSRNFSLGEEIQADGRNHRGGSQIHDKITKINLIAKDTVDETVLEAIQNKQDLAKNIVDLAKML